MTDLREESGDPSLGWSRHVLDDLDTAIKSGRENLLGLQHAEGWWKGELETNVSMDAEDVMLRHFLGILEPERTAKTAAWIRSQQLASGGWATFYGGPDDISVTVEAYVALRLAGDPPDASHMLLASQRVSSHGGIAATRVFTRIWMAVVGAWSWEDLPLVPPEIMLLPSGIPLNIYDFACWARQTIVAMSVVMAFKPAVPLPFTLGELDSKTGPASGPASGTPPRNARPESVLYKLLDRAIHAYDKAPGWLLPARLIRSSSLAKAERWILARQEADGLWGGIQPPVVYSIIALRLLGYPLDHPVLAAALRGLDSFTVDDERGLRLEACQSPVWDTALAIVALSDVGVAGDDPAMRRAAQWLLAEEIRVKGDWSVRRPDVPAGGWAFEFHNDNYPDVDDTAEVILALRRVLPDWQIEEACRRGVEWSVGMQSRSGGWGAFDADNDSATVAKLPFCDFGEVTDPPSADVTAHMVEMLAEEKDVDHSVLQRGIDWLWGAQEPDGSWFGRWGVNYVYGTGAVVPALVAAGVPNSDPRIRAALQWLAGHQNADGGWGEDLRSYVHGEWRGRGTSTPSQTAWALLALLAGGEHSSEAARRGVGWLIENQTADGGWDEPWFTGTGFPWDFSINYHLYRIVWPLMALGRYAAAVSKSETV
ncbi:MAG: squalene--hopene cyclase [Acidimicrobiales bacterium]